MRGSRRLSRTSKEPQNKVTKAQEGKQEECAKRKAGTKKTLRSAKDETNQKSPPPPRTLVMCCLSYSRLINVPFVIIRVIILCLENVVVSFHSGLRVKVLTFG